MSLTSFTGRNKVIQRRNNESEPNRRLKQFRYLFIDWMDTSS